MDSLIVYLSDHDGHQGAGAERAQVLEVEPGQTATFGWDVRSGTLDLAALSATTLTPSGVISATDQYWTISNLHEQDTYVVENIESLEFVKIAPRRREVPVPFELSRVVLPGPEGFRSFKVFGVSPSFIDPGDLRTDTTTGHLELNENAKYFLVLVALCEPRLRGESQVALPSVKAVVQRLRELDSCRSLTTTAANYHIDYLVTHKLRANLWDGASRMDGMTWKREALVSIALRHDLVREEHLALLPTRRSSTTESTSTTAPEVSEGQSR